MLLFVLWESNKENFEGEKKKVFLVPDYNLKNIYEIDLDKLKSNYILNNPNTLYKESRVLLNNLIEKLELVNPLGVLKRGYSLTKQDEKVITSIKNINKNKPLIIKLQDGIVETNIKNIKEENNG